MAQQIASIQALNSELSITTHKYCCFKGRLYAAPCHYVGLLLFIFVSIYPLTVSSQEVEYIDYIESFNSTADTNVVSLPILKKEHRLKSYSCLSFNIAYDSNVPDTIVKCLEVAADIWRSVLNTRTNNSIKLKLEWAELPMDEDLKISVAYIKNNDGIYTPSSMYYSLLSNSSNAYPSDATITINKNVDWYCGYNVNNGNCFRNLSYAMLRSIAIALGFGSSISLVKLNQNPIVKFQFVNGHSLFENLLVSENGFWLKDLSNTGKTQNPAIIDYCTGVYGDVYIDGNYINSIERDKYKMYTPSNYENTKSLIYLNNQQSLMHYSLDKSSTILQIDSITVNVLNKIGWNVVVPNQSNFKIIGSGIPESGITSAYNSHLFYIEGNGKNDISNAKWSFFLPTIDGNESLQKSSEGSLTFTIDKLPATDNYAVNVNGDIYGKILFSGLLNDNPINLQYNVTLELKPSISNVSFIRQNNENDNSYNVLCKVDYKGSDYLYVTLEEEYGSSLRSQFVREPYLAHFACNYINSPYYAWIDIKAENQYGNDVYTIDLPPYNIMESMCASAPNNIHSMTDKDFTEIKVYNSMGYYAKTIKEESETKNLQPGIYILEYYDKHSKVRTSKLLR